MVTYSNPRLRAEFDNWPFGRLQTTCIFEVESNSKGERVSRVTLNPKTGVWCKPKLSTYSSRCRIVDGDDGKTYILHYSKMYNLLMVEQSNLKTSFETLHASNWADKEKFNFLLSLLEQKLGRQD